jgi:hypothetical protein
MELAQHRVHWGLCCLHPDNVERGLTFAVKDTGSSMITDEYVC